MTRWIARLNVELLFGGAGLLLSAAATVLVLVNSEQPTARMAKLPIVVAFFVAIAAGELFRISLPGSRETAPMATAAALAFAMTVDSPAGAPASYSASLVIAVTALAMALGLLIRSAMFARRSFGVTSRASGPANRLVAVAVAAVLFRWLPVSGGRSVLQVHGSWEPWFLALVMVVVSIVALTVEVTLVACVRSASAHSPLKRTVADEFRAAFGLTAALSSTGALIALAERPLGMVAIPLFLLPLVLTQFAVRRQATIRRTYGQTIRSLSRLTELGGYTAAGHAGRVAALATAMGRDLGMSERDVLDLEYAALLHDIGQVSLTEPIPGGATVMAAPGDQRRIARDGAEIVRETGVLDTVAVIIEAQTTPYRQVREFGESLPLASRIIKVVNAYDDLAGDSGDPSREDTAIERIHLGLGYEYDPRVVDALTRVLARRTLA